MSDDHLDAIEAVLERHGLALVLETDDEATPWWATVDPSERVEKVARSAAHGAADTAMRSATGRRGRECALLDALYRRRLVMRLDDGYTSR